MANHKSAVKSHRLSIQRRDRNRQMRTRMRHALTKARSVIEAGDETKARQTIQNTVALIDKLAVRASSIETPLHGTKLAW